MTVADVLAVVPTFLREPGEVQVLLTCLETLRETAPDVEILVVDDGSPAPQLVEAAEGASSRLEARWIKKPENEGFSRTVNYGLNRAIGTGQDVVLVNADVEFIEAGWVERMRACEDPKGDPAAIVGAKLLYPNGLIQHGGIFFSLLSRVFEHRFKYAPADLVEANLPTACPVTGALQFIRHKTLTRVGVYDYDFRLGWEDVDFCLRTFKEGLYCVYDPGVMAYHHESLFRGRPTPKIQTWTAASWAHFKGKWAGEDFMPWVPAVVA